MSVEYALMLVVITGAVVGVLGLGLDGPFKQAICPIAAALNGGSCDGATVPAPVPTTSEPGPDATDGPMTQPIPARSTPPCDSRTGTSTTTTSASQTSGSDAAASGCPTSTAAD